MLVVILALPVRAADPSASPSASASDSASASASEAGSAASSAEASASAESSAAASASAEASVSSAPLASPAATGAPSASQEPGSPAEPTDENDEQGNGKGHGKKDKTPGVPIILTGVVGKTADPEPDYTLASGGKTYKLEAGPKWFFGANHPLAKFVGTTATIAGELRGDEIDVETVNGTRLREPGRPPWAGGWKRVGSRHPGWTQEKWDRWQARVGDAGCWPPGHCKAKESTVAPTPSAGAFRQ
jgi:hypothetical protein